MDNIILIGMPGTGKSTVGVVLAKLLGFDFIDTDLLMARRAGRPLSEIITQDGYNSFIALEGSTGAELRCFKTVVATGGSMVFSENAMKNLSGLGIVVWLDTPAEVIEQRIGGALAQRGVATPRAMTVADIYADREPLYRRWAQLRLPCEGNTEQVVADLKAALENYQKA